MIIFNQFFLKWFIWKDYFKPNWVIDWYWLRIVEVLNNSLISPVLIWRRWRIFYKKFGHTNASHQTCDILSKTRQLNDLQVVYSVIFHMTFFYGINSKFFRLIAIYYQSSYVSVVINNWLWKRTGGTAFQHKIIAPYRFETKWKTIPN